MNNYQLIAHYYAQNRSELVGFVTARLGDEAEAQDIVQTLFLRLLDGHRLTTEQTLPCLVYTMARNAIADHYRRRRVWTEYEHYLRGRDYADTSMESVFSATEVMERMERSLARLPEKCREVYRLHIYSGMKVSEIAQQTGEAYKSVEHRLGLARKVVRQQLRACI
ncbi:MAG: sigma-70 family RNA polymerase sigma factor [Prevotella sp.]|nr:sigma-70 family RNA polymerase sigma factor [Prevotella sp.]